MIHVYSMYVYDSVSVCVSCLCGCVTNQNQLKARYAVNYYNRVDTPLDIFNVFSQGS